MNLDILFEKLNTVNPQLLELSSILVLTPEKKQKLDYEIFTKPELRSAITSLKADVVKVKMEMPGIKQAQWLVQPLDVLHSELSTIEKSLLREEMRAKSEEVKLFMKSFDQNLRELQTVILNKPQLAIISSLQAERPLQELVERINDFEEQVEVADELKLETFHKLSTVKEPLHKLSALIVHYKTTVYNPKIQNIVNSRLHNSLCAFKEVLEHLSFELPQTKYCEVIQEPITKLHAQISSIEENIRHKHFSNSLYQAITELIRSINDIQEEVNDEKQNRFICMRSIEEPLQKLLECSNYVDETVCEELKPLIEPLKNLRTLISTMKDLTLTSEVLEIIQPEIQNGLSNFKEKLEATEKKNVIVNNTDLKDRIHNLTDIISKVLEEITLDDIDAKMKIDLPQTIDHFIANISETSSVLIHKLQSTITPLKALKKALLSFQKSRPKTETSRDSIYRKMYVIAEPLKNLCAILVSIHDTGVDEEKTILLTELQKSIGTLRQTTFELLKKLQIEGCPKLENPLMKLLLELDKLDESILDEEKHLEPPNIYDNIYLLLDQFNDEIKMIMTLKLNIFRNNKIKQLIDINLKSDLKQNWKIANISLEKLEIFEQNLDASIVALVKMSSKDFNSADFNKTKAETISKLEQLSEISENISSALEPTTILKKTFREFASKISDLSHTSRKVDVEMKSILDELAEELFHLKEDATRLNITNSDVILSLLALELPVKVIRDVICNEENENLITEISSVVCTQFSSLKASLCTLRSSMSNEKSFKNEKYLLFKSLQSVNSCLLSVEKKYVQVKSVSNSVFNLRNQVTVIIENIQNERLDQKGLKSLIFNIRELDSSIQQLQEASTKIIAEDIEITSVLLKYTKNVEELLEVAKQMSSNLTDISDDTFKILRELNESLKNYSSHLKNIHVNFDNFIFPHILEQHYYITKNLREKLIETLKMHPENEAVEVVLNGLGLIKSSMEIITDQAKISKINRRRDMQILKSLEDVLIPLQKKIKDFCCKDDEASKINILEELLPSQSLLIDCIKNLRADLTSNEDNYFQKDDLTNQHFSDMKNSLELIESSSGLIEGSEQGTSIQNWLSQMKEGFQNLTSQEIDATVLETTNSPINSVIRSIDVILKREKKQSKEKVNEKTISESNGNERDSVKARKGKKQKKKAVDETKSSNSNTTQEQHIELDETVHEMNTELKQENLEGRNQEVEKLEFEPSSEDHNICRQNETMVSNQNAIEEDNKEMKKIKELADTKTQKLSENDISGTAQREDEQRKGIDETLQEPPRLNLNESDLKNDIKSEEGEISATQIGETEKTVVQEAKVESNQQEELQMEEDHQEKTSVLGEVMKTNEGETPLLEKTEHTGNLLLDDENKTGLNKENEEDSNQFHERSKEKSTKREIKAENEEQIIENKEEIPQKDVEAKIEAEERSNESRRNYR
ncbi:hypothetical protein WA026_018450 [Henosepilachna vigintioctopunctata]|uniref:Uncharacterized protein n=1 Tax=Henosepilachna vigintioctopunctata TaxID=420089 RepID=A0AAW1UTK7_9CUCU